MLVDKRKAKTGKNKSRKDSSTSEESIQSFRSWIRKLEQTANSLSSRLSAVEKRISYGSFNSPAGNFQGAVTEGPIERLFTDLQKEKQDKVVEEISRILDKEFLIMQEELIAQQTEIATLKEKLGEVESHLTGFTEEIKNSQIQDSKSLNDLTTRLDKIESREPPVMKLAGIEIPIEITGVVGGILAFVLAILVVMDQKEIILSPLFLSLVGLVLIGSAIFKTFHIGSTISKSFKKTSKVKDRL
jgi:hypothetical protein